MVDGRLLLLLTPATTASRRPLTQHELSQNRYDFVANRLLRITSPTCPADGSLSRYMASVTSLGGPAVLVDEAS